MNNISQKIIALNLSSCKASPPEPIYSSIFGTSGKPINGVLFNPYKTWDSTQMNQGCIKNAFINQALLSQYYTYASGNNTLPNNK